LAPEFHGMLSAWEDHQRELLAKQNGLDPDTQEESDSPT